MSDQQKNRAAEIRKGNMVNTLLSLFGVAGLFLFLFVGWPNVIHAGEQVKTADGVTLDDLEHKLLRPNGFVDEETIRMRVLVDESGDIWDMPS